MAMLPTMRALALGFGLATAVVVGPGMDNPPAHAGPVGAAADDPTHPPAPGPAPGAQGPFDQQPPETPPQPHRRHFDGDPVVTH